MLKIVHRHCLPPLMQAAIHRSSTAQSGWDQLPIMKAQISQVSHWPVRAQTEIARARRKKALQTTHDVAN